MIRIFYLSILIVLNVYFVDGQNYEYYKVLKGHGAEVTFIAMRNEDNLLATGDKSGKILIWNINKGEIIHQIKAHQLEITHLAFGQNGDILASASYDGTIRIWDAKTFEKNQEIEVPEGIAYGDIKGNEPTFIALHPTKDLLFYGGYNSKVFQYHLKTNEQIELYEDDSFGITSGLLNPKGSQLFFSAGAEIYSFDLLDQKTSKKVSIQEEKEELGYICELALNKNEEIGAWLYGGKVNLYALTDFKLTKSLVATKEHGTSNISFDENGNFLLTGNDGSMTKIWDLSNNEIVQTLKEHKKRTITFAFSPDNQFIVTGSDDQQIIVWKKGKPVIDTSKLPKQVNGRSIEVQKIITTKKKFIELDFWDNKRIDGDIISVFFNGEEILSKHKLTRKKKTLKIPLEKEMNTITIYAHNLGKIPPNTVGVTWVDDKKRTEYTFQSDQEKSASILIQSK